MIRQYSIEVRLCLPENFVAADAEIKEALLAQGQLLYALVKKHHSPKPGEPVEPNCAVYTDDFFKGYEDLETAPAA